MRTAYFFPLDQDFHLGTSDIFSWILLSFWWTVWWMVGYFSSILSLYPLDTRNTGWLPSLLRITTLNWVLWGGRNGVSASEPCTLCMHGMWKIPDKCFQMNEATCFLLSQFKAFHLKLQHKNRGVVKALVDMKMFLYENFKMYFINVFYKSAFK